MGCRLEPRVFLADARGTGRRQEIAAFLACGGRADADSAAVRRRVSPDLPLRIWHRVFAFLPKEVRADGTLLVWHPVGQDWQRALEHVHADRPIHWRLSGARLHWPDASEPSLADLRDFDDFDIADWSLAVPDPRFRAFCTDHGAPALRLSELVARWAFEVGPQVAGRALAGCRVQRVRPAPSTH